MRNLYHTRAVLSAKHFKELGICRTNHLHTKERKDKARKTYLENKKRDETRVRLGLPRLYKMKLYEPQRHTASYKHRTSYIRRMLRFGYIYIDEHTIAYDAETQRRPKAESNAYLQRVTVKAI